MNLFIRCPHCNEPNLKHRTHCTRCGAEMPNLKCHENDPEIILKSQEAK